MKNPWRLVAYGLCMAAGCTSGVFERHPQQQVPDPLANGASPAGVVVASHREKRCQAKVGQAVHFGYGWTVVPDLMVCELQVAVNGERVRAPEFFSPDQGGKLGYDERVYVFRPKQPGEYRIEVTSVYMRGQCQTDTWVVEVSE